MKECRNEGLQDLVGAREDGLRRETPEVRLVGEGRDEVTEAYRRLGPAAQAMLAGLPKFVPVVQHEGMFQ